MTRVYIGLGSNLDNPSEKICQARRVIAGLIAITEVGFSSLYASPPMGPQDQPDYVNAVMCFDTDLTATELLTAMQKVEHDFGRVRKVQRWGARTLDVDILVFGDEQISSADLTIPHVGISERAFVLYPLAEIAPKELVIQGKGYLRQLLDNCALDGLEKLSG